VTVSCSRRTMSYGVSYIMRYILVWLIRVLSVHSVSHTGFQLECCIWQWFETHGQETQPFRMALKSAT